MKHTCKLLTLLIFISNLTFAQTKPAFKVVPLGVLGGIDESNLSAYMIAPYGSDNYVCLDAGTIYYGIEKAVANHVFANADTVFKRYIKAYCISHPHLDHVAGLIMNSPEDAGPKNIYALQSCLDVLRDNYFTWKSWANFANQGEKPALGKYTYVPLIPGNPVMITNTTLSVQAYTLSHVNPYESTAFLIKNQDNYVLYLGDTGADAVEKSDKLKQLWQQVSPLIKNKKLKAIMIETSFPNEQPDKALFGHLTPKLFMQEMDVLANFAGKTAMHRLPVVITHIKPSGRRADDIKMQLTTQNNLQLKIIIPEQGKLLEF